MTGTVDRGAANVVAPRILSSSEPVALASWTPSFWGFEWSEVSAINGGGGATFSIARMLFEVSNMLGLPCDDRVSIGGKEEASIFVEM